MASIDQNEELKKDKPYKIVIDYVKSGVLSGSFEPGQRLPGERELAEQLGVSRNSVREGLRILENMGMTMSQHGAGHYVSLNFDEPMTEMLSLIYTMKGMGRDDLTQFRYCLEREAMHLAVDYASEQQKIVIAAHLDSLLQAQTEIKWQFRNIVHADSLKIQAFGKEESESLKFEIARFFEDAEALTCGGKIVPVLSATRERKCFRPSA